MAYVTATVVDVDRNADGRIVIHILHEGNNNEEGVKQSVEVGNATSLAATFVRDQARERQTGLNANLAFRATARGLLNTVLDLTPPPPPPPPPPPTPPTPAEVARSAFLVIWRRLQAAQRAVQLGVLDATDPSYTALVAQARAAWLPQYLSVV